MVNSTLLQLIRGIDSLVIGHLLENQESWQYRGENLTLCQLEQELIPSIKVSSIMPDHYSLKLKIPCNQIEFYDQDGISVPYQLIKEDYHVVPLLRLTHICRDQEHIWIEWQLPTQGLST